MPFQRGHRRLQSDTTDAIAKEEARTETPAPSIDDDEDFSPAPWRALFYFTTKANLPILIAGIICSIVAGAAPPANAFLIGKIVGGFTSYAAGQWDAYELMAHEKKFVIYLVALAGASWLFHSLELMLSLAFGELQAKNARDGLFSGLVKKEVEWYDTRKNGVGALLPRVQSQIRDLQLSVAQPFSALISASSNILLSLIQAFVLSWDLTLVTLATTPLIVGIMVWLGNGMQGHITGQADKLAEAQKHSTNAFSSIETVKCFNGEEAEVEKYSKSAYQAALQYFRLQNLAALQLAVAVLLSVSMFVQGFYYGGILVANGKKGVEDIITTFMSAIGAFQALQVILPQLFWLEKGRSAGSTLRAITTQSSKDWQDSPNEGSHMPRDCLGDIEVRNVTFRYPSRPDQLALDDVTMFLRGGEMTFLIGKSGSGKSTISQLLMRFYSSREGTITVDGNLLEDLDMTWLRTNITLVEQHSLLFQDTVFQNIAFGRQDYKHVTREEAMEAASFALLQLMISDMPDGLDTMVGFKGGSMSGGQRQRMALARARLRDTPVLILDESTSALDHISRGLMMDAIRQWRRGKTTIIITHDISQIQDDDYLYLLERGRVAQEGYRGHLEMIKGGPFQAFLPQHMKAVSPTDDRKFDDSDSLLSDYSCSDYGSESEVSPTPQNDVREIRSAAGEQKKRLTYLGGLGNEATPLAGIRGVNRGGGPTSSPWLRLATTGKPPSPAASIHRTSRDWGKDVQQRPVSILCQETSESQNILDKLVDRTGKLAAEARENAGKVVRRRVNFAEEPFEEMKKKKPKFTRRRRGPVDADENIGAYPKQTLPAIFKTIWPSVDWSTRVVIIMGFVGATVHAAGTPVFSFVLSKLLQTYAVPGGDKHKALMYSMAILGIAFVDAVGTYIFRLFLEWAAQCWVDSVREQALKRILDQPRDFFDKEENSVSRLVDSLDRNAEEMRHLLGRFAALGSVVVLMVVMSLAWAIASSWKLTLISSSAVPYIYLTTKVYASISARWETISNDAAEHASVIFTETFSNIKTVRALTLEKHFEEKYFAATDYSLRVGFRRSFYIGFFYGLSESAGSMAEALIIYVGARLVSSGSPPAGIITVFTMLIFAVQSVSGMLGFIPQIGNAQDTASRLLRLARPPETPSHEHSGNTRITSIGTITLTNLSFAYPSRPEQQVLKSINLTIPPGTTTALVGGSGSGKSTISNLLLNLYPSAPPTTPSGTITIAHRPLPTIHTPSLRNLIIPIQQTPAIFPLTIFQNIAYGLAPSSPYASPRSIHLAAQRAGIHDFITSLPSSYDTLIGEGGTGLSGGQAQRIAIARALVRKPQVLILDEATSALDVESAGVVRQSILRLVKEGNDGQGEKMTVLIITHAKEMMEIAERVVVLDQGSVVETGGFEELLGRKGGVLGNLLRGGEWNEDGDEGEGGMGYQEEAEEVRGQRDERPFPKLSDVDWSVKNKGKRRVSRSQ